MVIAQMQTVYPFGTRFVLRSVTVTFSPFQVFGEEESRYIVGNSSSPDHLLDIADVSIL